MNISQSLQANTKILSKISDTPQIDAELLLSFVLDKNKSFLYTYPEHELSKEELKIFTSHIKTHLSGYSVAYIIGRKDFYGLEFIVNKHTLVPRPETELMVDEVLSILKEYKGLDSLPSLTLAGNDKVGGNNISLIDLGTGSGCIPISILKNNEVANIKCFAVDISPKALEIAMKNAKKHTLAKDINFLEGNLLAPIINSNLAIKNNNIIITANLPYLTKEQIKNSPSIQKEPVLALDGGKDGMDYYIELFKQIKDLKNKYQPESITILAEIDHTQVEVFEKETKDLLPQAKLTIKKDLGGYERLVILKI